MKHRLLTLSISAIVISAFSLLIAQTAAAHVVVKPAEVASASFQTFTVSVPNEKDIATTEVKLLIPAGLDHVSLTTKPGWDITAEKKGSGETATITSITWTNGSIEPGFRDDFTFSAKAPAEIGDIQWKAYQTYEDGTVVAWDQVEESAKKDDPNTGPFSVTKIVAETANAPNSDKATGSTDNSTRSLYLSIAATVVSLAALFFATRKK